VWQQHLPQQDTSPMLAVLCSCNNKTHTGVTRCHPSSHCLGVTRAPHTWLRSVAASFQALVAKWMLWLSWILDRW
jgi:hypothetical protein